MKELAMATLVTGGVCAAGATSASLPLTQEWDKVFSKSEKVEHCKATFKNRFGITLAADVYKPKGATGSLAAIAVSGPFGAVKEQSSGLYAQTLAERGFLTIAFDPSFTGESGGMPRYVASPDINTEDFQAAVDYLISRDDVDADKIGILGICGWGGLAINAAAVDTRVKATVASTMYDMTRVTANGYFDKEDSAAARKAKKEAMNAQRIKPDRTSLAEAFPTSCRTTLRSSSRTTTPTTRRRAATTHARSIRTADGTRPRRFRSSMRSCLHTRARSRAR